jgi:type IV secretory pathway VirD2 relaxase
VSGDDEDLIARLGRIGPRGRNGRPKSTLALLSERVSRAGGPARLALKRGGSLRRALRPPPPSYRRAIVKARIVKLTRAGLRQQTAHLSYIEREGADRDGAPAQLYDRGSDEADGRAFAERCAGDRHQFRFIVSPEDGQELASLRPFVRDLMRTAELDLGTRLDWVAADHYDTEHPHTHIVLRGRNADGTDLVIPKAYIAHGLRQRACERLSVELGPESALERWRKVTSEIEQERFTGLDRQLVDRAEDGLVVLDHQDRMLKARLKRLEAMDLAWREGDDAWRLDGDLEPRLRRMGERGDIIKTMNRALRRAGIERPLGAEPEWSSETSGGRALEGRLVKLGIADELNDRSYAVVDGLDGRAHYVDLGTSAHEARVGSFVRIEKAHAAPRKVDRTIAEIAAEADGRYDEPLHRAHDPTARTDYIRTHARRLEALRREGVVDRGPDGAWRIPEDYAARALEIDRERAAREPARLEVVGRGPLDDLAAHDGATWLDERLAGPGESGIAETGFGAEAREALRLRRLWLARRELLDDGETRLSAAALDELRGRELRRVGAGLEEELGRPYAPARPGQRIEGVLAGARETTIGKVAVIERALDFTLVPWRDVLEDHIGKRISGGLSVDGVSWDLRQRTLGR